MADASLEPTGPRTPLQETATADILWDPAVAAVRLGLDLRWSPDFRETLVGEAAARGREPDDLGGDLQLRVLMGDGWNRELAERLYPEMEVSDE